MSPVPMPKSKLLKDEKFAAALHRVSVDHTVIVAVGNVGFVPMLKNLIATSIERFKLKNFLVVALTVGMCSQIPSSVECYMMPDVASGGGGSYGSKGFARLVNVKTEVVMASVSLGYNSLLVDGDIVFLKNPLPHLQGPYDLHIQVRDKGASRITSHTY